MNLKQIKHTSQPALGVVLAILFAVQFVLIGALHHHDFIEDATQSCHYCIVKSYELDHSAIELELPPVQFEAEYLIPLAQPPVSAFEAFYFGRAPPSV